MMTAATTTTEPTTTESRTFNIPEVNLDGFKAKIEKLNKRARKLGVPEITVNETGHEDVQIFDADDRPTGRYNRVIHIDIIGVAPQLAGWSFVAALEHVEGEVMVRSAPSFRDQDLKHYRNADPTNCDHCHTSRRRHETFVLRHEDGTLKQIGRNCLVDFLGGKDPKQIAAMAEFLFEAMAVGEAEEEGSTGGGGGAGNRVGLSAFLSHVAMAIRKCGWVSRGMAQNDYSGSTQASAAIAGNVMFCRDFKAKEDFRRAGLVVTPEDHAVAMEAIGWARTEFGGKAQDDRSDYEHNAYVATKGETISGKAMGIAASVVAGYQRHLNNLKERALSAQSEYEGVVGERSDFYVTVISTKQMESAFGLTTLVKFKTRAGNTMTWFASGEPELPAQAVITGGVVVTPAVEAFITGTVKKHDEFKGSKQTQLSRVVVWTAEGRAAHEAKLAAKAAKAAAKVERDAAKAAKAEAKAAKLAAKGAP